METIIESMGMRGAWCMQLMIVEWLAYSSKVANVIQDRNIVIKNLHYVDVLKEILAVSYGGL
jgi:hypothetical protein